LNHPNRKIELTKRRGVQLNALTRTHVSPLRLCVIVLLFSFLAACDFVESDPPEATLTPTRALSGPTLAPSATVVILSATQMSSDFAVGQNDLTAASVPSGGSLPPLVVTSPPGSLAQRVQIASTTGTLLYGDLYETGTARVPAVLLLGADYNVWGDFPLRLQQAGFTVLVLPVSVSTTSEDFRAVLVALSEVGTVNPGSIGVVGAETGADLALIGCATDDLCDATALLTPVSGNTLLNIITDYNPRPLFLAASRNDTDSFGIIQALEQLAMGEVLLQPYENAGRGTVMLQSQPDLANMLIAWLQEKLNG
jgi:hypothetical protein